MTAIADVAGLALVVVLAGAVLFMGAAAVGAVLEFVRLWLEGREARQDAARRNGR